jgi:hypothetical protein
MATAPRARARAATSWASMDSNDHPPDLYRVVVGAVLDGDGRRYFRLPVMLVCVRRGAA